MDLTQSNFAGAMLIVTLDYIIRQIIYHCNLVLLVHASYQRGSRAALASVLAIWSGVDKLLSGKGRTHLHLTPFY